MTKIIGGAVLCACATLGLIVLISSVGSQQPNLVAMYLATLGGAVAGTIWQLNETRKEKQVDTTIQHLTSQLRKGKK
jgi:uncharacterized membrane protein YqjE